MEIGIFPHVLTICGQATFMSNSSCLRLFLNTMKCRSFILSINQKHQKKSVDIWEIFHSIVPTSTHTISYFNHIVINKGGFFFFFLELSKMKKQRIQRDLCVFLLLHHWLHKSSHEHGEKPNIHGLGVVNVIQKVTISRSKRLFSVCLFVS